MPQPACEETQSVTPRRERIATDSMLDSRSTLKLTDIEQNVRALAQSGN
jgi:hypothetical protein